MTTGLLDADALADAFELRYKAEAGNSVFRLWADARLAVWRDIVNPMSAQNTQRVVHTDPDNPKADPFLKMIMEKDPNVKALNDTFNNSLITDMRQVLDTHKFTEDAGRDVGGKDSASITVPEKFTYAIST